MSWQEEAAALCRAHGTTLKEMLDGGRQRRLVEARRAVAAMLRGRRLSYPQIGRLLNRDHSSILHLLRGRGQEAGTP